MKNKQYTSYLMMVGSMLIFGTIGIFRRYIPFSSGLLACARGILGAACLVLFVRIRRRKLLHGIGRKNMLLLALTGAAIGFNWILLFEAYNYTTVATATLCYYMQPTIVILLAPIFFRERLTGKKLACAAVSLLGMILVSGITDGQGIKASDVRGILFGLGAAALYASVIILNKSIQVEDAFEKTTIQLASAAAVMIPYLIFTEDLAAYTFTPAAIIMTVVVGVVHTGFAYAMYFSSMNGLGAQSVAVLSYIDPVSALILSALILGEKMTPAGMVGAVLIIGAALLCELPVGKRKMKHAE